MNQERKQVIIAIDATALFKAIEHGNIKFNHGLPEGVIYRSCRYDFQSNEIMFLVEHESFGVLHGGMLAPVIRAELEKQ